MYKIINTSMFNINILQISYIIVCLCVSIKYYEASVISLTLSILLLNCVIIFTKINYSVKKHVIRWNSSFGVKKLCGRQIFVIKYQYIEMVVIKD